MDNVRQYRGTWVFLVPISNLRLTQAVNHEFRIDQINFVGAEKLPRIRKRLGIPKPISHYQRDGVLGGFFSSQCFATIQRTGKLSDLEEPVLELIREELAILAVSQLIFKHRHQISSLSISDETPRGTRSYLAINRSNKSWRRPSELLGGSDSLWLDGHWKHFSREAFFTQLLKIINGQIKVADSWQRDLRNAAIFAGQSQSTLDVPQAFLWNMIALELLLTRREDKISTVLPNRVKAFLGWVGFWEVSEFEQWIETIYKKRSALVHSGCRDQISRQDVLFTDHLLFNLFINIVEHHKIFKSKDAVIEFSRKVEAEHLLGIDAKTRPKTLRYMSRVPSMTDSR